MSNFGHNLSDSDAPRLDAVRTYGGDDPEPDPVLDRFTTLASTLFTMPIALISLVGESTVRFKSCRGIDLVEMPRRNLLCDAVANSGIPLIVHDTANDPSTADSRMVATFGIKFYAGMPLHTSDGLTLGAFALADTVHRPDFTEKEATTLAELARAVVAELELRRQLSEKRRMIDDLSLRQEIAGLTAAAPSLTAALDSLLSLVGQRFHALYCAISEGDPARATYRVIAGFAEHPEIGTILNGERRSAWRPLTELSCAAALTDQIPVDTGPIETPAQVAAYPGFAAAVGRGTRRQLTLPIVVDQRRFALSIGFREATLSPETTATCNDLVEWITPLLQGRLREDALARANGLLARSNQALQTLHASHDAVARATDEASLTQTICDLAITHGGYSAAWVGIAEPPPECRLRPIAMAGTGIDNIWNVVISWADNPNGHGPSGTAVREGRPVIVNDILSDPALSPWHPLTNLARRTAAFALPLQDESGHSFGSLTFLAEDRWYENALTDSSFDAEEIKVLTQLAADLAYGIGALRARRARDTAIAEQRTAEQRLARLLEASPTIVYALERPHRSVNPADWHLTEISGNIERLYGHNPAATRAPQWWFDHIHPDDRADALAAERRLLTENHVVHRYRFARTDGTYRWVRDEKSIVPGPPGRPDTIVGAWVDITEKHEADRAIQRLAYYDALTDLPNRALLLTHLGQALIESRLTGQHGTLMFIALNGIEAIQDLHGHAAGEAVLRQIGRILNAGLRKHDMIAHIADDKFAILLAPLADTPQSAAKLTQRIAEKLLLTLAEPIHAGGIAAGHDYHISANVGIAMVPGRAATIEDIVRQADMAVRQARASDRTPILFFESRMQDQVAERHLIELALRDAMVHDRFEVWLQSQVDRAGQITGAEALIRLRRPDGVLVPPNDFIPIAEETGIVFAMGRWMLRAVCRIIAAQIARGQYLRVSINVSPRQFHDPDFVADVEAALAEAGAEARYLMIEITESLLIDRIEETRALLNTLAARGISFSVDDFGTGYSSLGYLQNLPIAEIKIDRSFIQRLPDNPRDATLAEAILSMTRHLGLVTVAEGVETEAQAAFLRARDCDMMQGYLFGRPEPAAAWLARWGTTQE